MVFLFRPIFKSTRFNDQKPYVLTFFCTHNNKNKKIPNDTRKYFTTKKKTLLLLFCVCLCRERSTKIENITYTLVITARRHDIQHTKNYSAPIICNRTTIHSLTRSLSLCICVITLLTCCVLFFLFLLVPCVYRETIHTKYTKNNIIFNMNTVRTKKLNLFSRIDSTRQRRQPKRRLRRRQMKINVCGTYLFSMLSSQSTRKWIFWQYLLPFFFSIKFF